MVKPRIIFNRKEVSTDFRPKEPNEWVEYKKRMFSRFYRNRKMN